MRVLFMLFVLLFGVLPIVFVFPAAWFTNHREIDTRQVRTQRVQCLRKVCVSLTSQMSATCWAHSRIPGETSGWNLLPLVCLSGVVVCHRRNVRFEFYTDVSSGILTYYRRIVRFEYFTEVFLGVRRCRRRNVRFASLTDVTAGIVVYCRTTLVFHLVQASV